MNLEERVLIHQHNRGDASGLIEEYLPFIAACASKHGGRRIGPEEEEFVIAMSAFCEAMQTFDGRKGRFLPFASLVIRNRLIDAARKGAAVREIPFSALAVERDGEMELYEVEDRSQQDRRDVTQEIDALSAELLTLGVRFDELVDATPRAGKTRAACAAAVRMLLASPAALTDLAATGRLPIAYLARGCALPRKILERHRKYIIAAAVILSGDYTCLREYVSFITGE